jgi:predicted transposase YbfD/YdcC
MCALWIFYTMEALMSFSLPANAPLLLAFGDLPDPRKQRNQHYPLIDIISVVVMGIICSADDFVAVYRWACHRDEWLRSMGLCLNGVPSHDTMNRVFRMLDPKNFNNCFMQWVRMIAEVIEGVIAIDGKTLCNSGDEFQQTSPLHIVHAFATENHLLLGQLATDAKSNEITAIPELLKMLTIKGNVITTDAMGCQTEIVKQIREQEGDYVIALKGNQGTLHAEAENFFQQAMDVDPSESGCDFVSSIEKNRGRIEERQVWSCSLDWLSTEQREDWIDLKTLVCVKSTRTHKGKTTHEMRYYISSLPSNAQRLAQIVRAHWGVENKLHWHLDVSFGEDLCKVRTDHAAENFSLAKKMALNLLKADTSEKLGVPNKRKLAGWSPEYLLKILGVK